jgi:hypothetical protein
MKLFIQAIFLFFFFLGCPQMQIEAQTRSSNTGTVVNRPAAARTSPKANLNEISRVDFRNFTFPGFGGANPEKSIAMKNGRSETTKDAPKYFLRKTYYFDLTGSEQDEAISHIIAEGCQMGCDRSSLFYIHAWDSNQPKLSWKIAVGGDVMGGLKSANFDFNRFVIEVFGDCRLEDGVIKPDVDLKKNAALKTTNYTRFVFTGDDKGFTQTSREVLPLPTDFDLQDYRSKISFGEF